MTQKLYIPKTITVGFQNRPGTFTGKLAYIIYTDEKNVLRKEASWQSWRDKNIDPITFDNTPQTGYCFNKGIRRYSDWGSGRSVVRVWDPRDFEFEISVDNLMGILMHSDVSKRDIQEQCIFAWAGTELVLLPINSEEYQQALVTTQEQETFISARDLIPGHLYKKKKEDGNLTYIGKVFQYSYPINVQEVLLPRSQYSYRDFYSVESRTFGTAVRGKKLHLFVRELGPNHYSKQTRNLFWVSDIKSLVKISDDVSETYAEDLEFALSSPEVSPITKLEFEKVSGPALLKDLNLTWEFQCFAHDKKNFLIGNEYIYKINVINNTLYIEVLNAPRVLHNDEKYYTKVDLRATLENGKTCVIKPTAYSLF